MGLSPGPMAAQQGADQAGVRPHSERGNPATAKVYVSGRPEGVSGGPIADSEFRCSGDGTGECGDSNRKGRTGETVFRRLRKPQVGL